MNRRKITITPEMLNAGSYALMNFNLDGQTCQEGAELIYKAMESARRTPRRTQIATARRADCSRAHARIAYDGSTWIELQSEAKRGIAAMPEIP